jgi:hypothetical protein
VRAAVFEQQGDSFRVALTVPVSFPRLVSQVGLHISLFDERYRFVIGSEKTRGPVSFSAMQDEGLNIFGTKTRLLHLMALAREGPVHLSDLRRITGSQKLAIESYDNAPFGRASVVRIWETDDGPAAVLDPDFPMAHELKLLLLKLTAFYFIPALHDRTRPPSMPPRQPWHGDKYALFGGEIATSILMTIGSLGWTFEGLCVNATPGCHRENIKKILIRFEREGILKSDRAARPGFDPRIVRLSPSFPAMAELSSLLRRSVEIWPEFDKRSRGTLANLPKKTRVHLSNRGLISQTTQLKIAAPLVSAEANALGRKRCIEEYEFLAVSLGKFPSSGLLMSTHSNLYRRIRRHWGTIQAFRIDASVSLPVSGSKKVSHPLLRSRCLTEYRSLSKRIGFDANVSDLRQYGEGGLYERIKLAWGGFPAFVSDVRPTLSRQRRDPARSVEAKKADSIARYRALAAKLGHGPTTTEIDVALKKQIYKTWGSFRSFLSETQIVTNCPLLTFDSLEGRRLHCLAQYGILREQFGHSPSSVEIQRISPGLYRHIKIGWGGFQQFCADTGLRPPRITKEPRPRSYRNRLDV